MNPVNEKYEAYITNKTPKNFKDLFRSVVEYAGKIGSLVFSHLHWSQYFHACENAAERVVLDLKEFDPQKASFSTWAYRSIYADLLDWNRKRTRRLALHAEHVCMMRNPYVPPENRLLLHRILSSLSEDERELLRLKSDDYSLEEMAAHFGVSVATIKRRWNAVVTRSREILAPAEAL